MTNQVKHLFVYGSLLSFFETQKELGISRMIRRVDTIQLRGRLYNLGAYPGALLGDKNSRIRGELYEILEAGSLEIIDRYEGFDSSTPDQSLFVRQIIRGYDVPFYIYVYNRSVDVSQYIENGDWIQHCK